MRVGPGKVMVEEYIVKPDGSEFVTKRWGSMMECAVELGLDHRAIRGRLNAVKGQRTSLGVFRYRRVDNGKT